MISLEWAPQVCTEIILCCQLEKLRLKMEEIRDISGLEKEKKNMSESYAFRTGSYWEFGEDIEPLFAENLD